MSEYWTISVDIESPHPIGHVTKMVRGEPQPLSLEMLDALAQAGVRVTLEPVVIRGGVDREEYMDEVGDR